MLFHKTGLLLTGLIFSVSFFAKGQTGRKIALDEAIQLSLQTSKQLKYDQAKVDEANAVLHQSRNNMLPDINVSGAYMRMHAPNVNLKLEGPQSKALTTIKVNQTAYALGTASLPIFSGFSIRYGIESAKYLAEAAKLDATNDKESLIQTTVSAYSNFYKATVQVSFISESLKQAQKRVTDLTNQESSGTAVRNDLLKAQLQASNVQLSLLEAESDLKMAVVNMNILLGLPEDTELAPDTAWFMQTDQAGTVAEWESKALLNRKDILALHLREKSAHLNIKAAKSSYYPGLAVTGNYIAADIPNLLTVTDAIGIGLGVKYNFGALWKTEAKVAQSKAKYQQLLMNEGMLDDQIRIQINQSYQDYVLSMKKIDVYNQSVAQTTENYNILQSQYANKVVTTTDVLEAEVALLQAKLNYAFSRADAVVAYKKLLQTAGLLTN